MKIGAVRYLERKMKVFAMPTTDGGACVTMITWSGSSSLASMLCTFLSL